MLIEQILQERFVNLIGDDARKERHKDAAYDMLQQTYASIGGIKGSGFNSPDDMVENIPFWKLAFKDGW
jgi:hypothetical protein